MSRLLSFGWQDSDANESDYDRGVERPDPSPLIKRVLESNRQAADAAARWAAHRARVMEVLADVTRAGGRLGLVGAGHLHDVRLDELVAGQAEIALVDLDPGPVRHAVERLTTVGARISIHAPVDLTGVLDLLPGAGNDASALARLMVCLAAHACHIPGEPFDVTVSLGVLTQLMQAVSDSGVAPADVPHVSLAVRDKHLRDLVRLTRPGGTLVIVTDIVASTSAPALVDLPERELEPTLARLVSEGNFFTGTNPYRLVAVLEEEAPFRADIARARFVGPWLWRITPDRQHLTGAIVAERRRR
jgi:hypothetical protein